MNLFVYAIDMNKKPIREDGFYHVQISGKGFGSKWIIALYESGDWHVVGSETKHKDEHFSKISEVKIQSPDVDIHEEFEQIWEASGEGMDKLEANKNGEYTHEDASNAFMWFSLGKAGEF